MTDQDAIIEFDERRKRTYLEMLLESDQKHDAAHKRIRDDLREMKDAHEEAMVLMRDATNAIRGRVDLIEKTPPQITDINVKTPIVAGLIIATITILGTGYGVGSMVLGRIDRLSTRIDQGAESQKLERESTTKLQEERAARLASDIAALKAQSTMNDLKITNLREMLLSKGKQ